MGEMNRRDFVVLAAGCACACASGEALAQPRGREPEVRGVVDVGTPADYTEDGLYDAHLRSEKVLMVRGGGRLYALSGICTHKACTVRVRDKKIVCPCHGSGFDNAGLPMKEPAKAPLFRFGIALEDGRILVDRSKRFGEKEWEKSESYLVMEA